MNDKDRDELIEFVCQLTERVSEWATEHGHIVTERDKELYRAVLALIRKAK